jgi:hypothetical protein
VTIIGRTSGLPPDDAGGDHRARGPALDLGPWGEVHWVRNLRAAGRATITVRRREEAVDGDGARPRRARGLLPGSPGAVARSLPGGTWFIRTVDGVDLDDPVDASHGRPVFELHPAR